MDKRKPSPLSRRASEMVRRTLCGIIESSNDDYVLEPNDVITIRLCDITAMEWPHTESFHMPRPHVISSINLDSCVCFPIPFTLYYNNEEIDENLCYGIRCDIYNNSKEIKYTSDRFIRVLTEKYPKTNVNIIIHPSNSF